MKKSILLLAILLGFNLAHGQSCCKMGSDKSFAQLAMNDQFAAAHLDPLPFTGEKEKGKLMQFPAKDKTMANGYFLPAETPTNNWLFIFHEWWGLNPYIKQEADKFKKEFGNCNILAIDLYDGEIATDAKKAQELSSSLKSERATSIIEGAIAYAGAEAKIVSLGWCLGGGWSLQSAMLASGQANGCVVYYGMPETDEQKITKFPCDILGIYGKHDKFITQEMIIAFESKLKASEIPHNFKFYNAEHAFANPSNPKHNVEATKDANALTMEYLRTKFNQQ
ncbi:MAG: dienelactone hydrolase family protein [Bacteroidota bacterium]